MRDHGLVKTQVSHQLLNYKKEMFDFQQSAIILSASSILELEQMICDGMLMTTPELPCKPHEGDFLFPPLFVR
jgi:hypothetical protein